MSILSWLRGEHIEGTIRRAHRECGYPEQLGLGETEIRQARVLDRMTTYDAEHVRGWTGPNHDIPIMKY
jgi:hypothetical protein